MNGKPDESLMDGGSNRSSALGLIMTLLSEPADRDTHLDSVCRILSERFPAWSWIGFYMVVPGTRELELGPFIGEPTEHVRIPFGKGICGQAAESEKTFVVPDVNLESNYLSCSPRVRSEIVIPIFSNGSIAAELDIDSHIPDAFTDEDRKFLEKAAVLVSPLFSRSPHRDS